jgi:hypothetical protein
MNSKRYEQRFAGYVRVFRDYKTAVGFHLKVHTALGVDAANVKLDGQSADLKLIRQMVHTIFRKLDTPLEHEILEFIDEHGDGDPATCVNNEAILRDLISLTGKPFASFDPTSMGNNDRASEYLKNMLNQELAEDLDKAFETHMAFFNSKLDLQRQELEDTITSTGDRIIDSLSRGAYKKVVDEARDP